MSTHNMWYTTSIVYESKNYGKRLSTKSLKDDMMSLLGRSGTSIVMGEPSIATKL